MPSILPCCADPPTEAERQEQREHLIYALLAYEPTWRRLPCPAPLFGEEFLMCLLGEGWDDKRAMD